MEANIWEDSPIRRASPRRPPFSSLNQNGITVATITDPTQIDNYLTGMVSIRTSARPARPPRQRRVAIISWLDQSSGDHVYRVLTPEQGNARGQKLVRGFVTVATQNYLSQIVNGWVGVGFIIQQSSDGGTPGSTTGL